MPKVITTEKWVERAVLKHGNKYDYTNSVYLGCQKPINIICPIHGTFTTLPTNHLLGHGCPECGKLTSSKKLASNVNSFIDKANKIHNYKYDYSKVNYINNRTKVIIVCPVHGEFLATPNSHLTKHSGCPKCGREKAGNKKRKTLEEFIKEAREVHGYKYDYSKVVYKNTQSKIEIICEKHGEFEQIAKDHLHGSGCPKCYNEVRGESIKSNTKEFIERAIKLHRNKYDYSKVSYISATEKVCIICPKHGEFWQTPSGHLNGQGCPYCKSSHGEVYIKSYLEENNINYIPQFKVDSFKVDFYLPDLNIVIEYNGILHYTPIEHFGGIERFKKQIGRDKYIRKYCEENNIFLIEIPYSCSTNLINEILKNMNDKVIVTKLLLTIQTDIETGETLLLNREVINDDIDKKKSSRSSTKTSAKASAKVDTNPEPIITLDSNKLILTQGAVDLLQVCEDCRVDIKYKKKDKKAVPIIGTDAAFGTKSGNKLTKSNTVSYRGAANEKLSAYGTVFKLEPTEDKGIYYLVGDKAQEEHPVPEEIINIESELDIESLDNLNIDEDDKDLGKFDFNLN